MNLSGQQSAPRMVALVTGAGTGIGRAVAITLLQNNYQVVLTGRRLEALQETVSLAAANNEDSLCVSCDIGNPDQVKSLFRQCADSFSRLDVLFNNAGSAAPAIPIEDLSYEQWRTVLDVNLTGAFLCSQQAIKMMKMQQPMGGRIVNNGSISAHVPRPNSAPYTATKSAITGLTKSISLDGRAFNIACGQIDIGNAATPMTKGFSEGLPQANGDVCPEPTMDVEQVAQAVLQMVSLPLETNVQFMTIMATKMPYIGRG
jgi:NAD(P)-dependent dehydrogenase (short-subunit alcohol dehydrogenase family)